VAGDVEGSPRGMLLAGVRGCGAMRACGDARDAARGVADEPHAAPSQGREVEARKGTGERERFARLG
jgi:hypothetical protein